MDYECVTLNVLMRYIDFEFHIIHKTFCGFSVDFPRSAVETTHFSDGTFSVFSAKRVKKDVTKSPVPILTWLTGFLFQF